MLHPLIALGTIEEGDQHRAPPPVIELYADCCLPGQGSCAEVATTMQAQRPLLQMPLANGHPDLVDIWQDAYRSELAFMQRARLRNQSSDGEPQSTWPSACGIPLVLENRKLGKPARG